MYRQSERTEERHADSADSDLQTARRDLLERWTSPLPDSSFQRISSSLFSSWNEALLASSSSLKKRKRQRRRCCCCCCCSVVDFLDSRDRKWRSGGENREKKKQKMQRIEKECQEEEEEGKRSSVSGEREARKKNS